MPVDITEKYIRIRVREPNLFIEGSFRTITLSESQGIKSVMGKLKSDPNGSLVIQNYMFLKEKWTVEEAQKWVDEHGKMADYEHGMNEIIDLSADEKENKDMNTKKLKTYACEVKDFNDEKMSFVAVASTESPDRDGDVLEVNGWNLKNYKKNPVILWGHDANLMPIGKALNVWIEGTALKFEVQFAPPEVNPFAKNVYEAYKQGFLSSFSVRFDPMKWEDMPHEQGDLRYGRRYKAHELLEISCVNIPANPEAHKSRSMAEFIHKSFLFEQYGKDCKDFGFNLAEIYEKADSELKGKIEKLNTLLNTKKEIIENQKIEETEAVIDKKIAEVEQEIELMNKEILLKQNVEELQEGITLLLKK